jgi:hypothetical protein
VTATRAWRPDHPIAANVRDLWHGGQEGSCDTGHDAAGRHRPIVLIDRPASSRYRVDIYSPSDQPVSASAGVFSFPAPATRSQNMDGRGFKLTEFSRELNAAIAANLLELGFGG